MILVYPSSTGVIGILWYIVWFWIIDSTPEKDKSISPDERRYIQETIGICTKTEINIPWKSIITSVPVWAIITAHFAEN